MKFEEILPHLREGKRIRCSNWREGICIYLKEGYLYRVEKNKDGQCGPLYHNVHIYTDDMLCNKWELYEETSEIIPRLSEEMEFLINNIATDMLDIACLQFANKFKKNFRALICEIIKYKGNQS